MSTQVSLAVSSQRCAIGPGFKPGRLNGGFRWADGNVRVRHIFRFHPEESRFDTEQTNEPRIEMIYGNRAEFHFKIMKQSFEEISD